MAEWIRGTPKEKGKYWLCLHDQNFNPFIVAGEVYTRLESSKEIFTLLKDGKKSEAKKLFDSLPLFITIPEMQLVPHKLGGLWNCDAYMRYSTPQLPEWMKE